MTWFKVDDSLHSHPKAMAASLAALGLWTVAGSWSSDHLTDGFIPDHMILSLSRGQAELAEELCAAGLWKRSKGGYQFHQWQSDADGTPRNPSKKEVVATRQKKSTGGQLGNHRRWHVDKGVQDPECRYCQQTPPSDNRSHDRSEERYNTDRSSESGPNPPVPSRPVPSRRDGTSPGDQRAGDQSVRTGARMREATRWLHNRYGLTDDEAVQVIREVQSRAREPIRSLGRYLDQMAEGSLADIVAAVMDAGRPAPPEPETAVPPVILHAVPDLPRGAEPSPEFLAAKARISRRGAR